MSKPYKFQIGDRVIFNKDDRYIYEPHDALATIIGKYTNNDNICIIQLDEKPAETLALGDFDDKTNSFASCSEYLTLVEQPCVSIHNIADLL